MKTQPSSEDKWRSVVMRFCLEARDRLRSRVLTMLMPAAARLRGAAEPWNSPAQSAPNFALARRNCHRGDREGDRWRAQVRLHLAGTLQIHASNITQAVGENVVQIGEIWLIPEHPGGGHPRLPMLSRPTRISPGRRGARTLYREVVRQKGRPCRLLTPSAAVHVGAEARVARDIKA